jgi:hypothetical protein
MFDASVMNGFEHLLGCGLPPHSLLQAQQSTKLGGLGLRASKNHSAAAYLASSFSSTKLMELFLRKKAVIPHLESSLVTFNSMVSPESHLGPDSTPSKQHLLSIAIDQQSFKSSLAALNTLDKARRLSCSMPHAGAWIRALPIFQNKFSSQEWVISMKRWLGIPLFDEEHLCVACQAQVMDVWGHHAVVCACSGDRIKRHNAVRDCFFEGCRAAAWGPIKEMPFLFSGSSERPADIFIPNYSVGRNLVVDTAVTCPLQSKYVAEASRSPGSSCNSYAQEVKTDKFESRVLQEGHDYLPIVLESFGGVSEGVEALIQKISYSISIRFSESKSICQKNFYDNLSCVLMKHIARSVSSRFPEFRMSYSYA